MVGGGNLPRPHVRVSVRGEERVFISDILYDLLHDAQTLAVFFEDPRRTVHVGNDAGDSPVPWVFGYHAEISGVYRAGDVLPIPKNTVWLTPYKGRFVPGDGSFPEWYVQVSADGSVQWLPMVESAGAFWRGFSKGAAVWAAVVAATVYTAGLVNTPAGLSAVPAVDGAIGLTPWEIATGGMAEGMGTGGVIASTPLVSAPVAAQSATSFTVPVLGSSAPVAETVAGSAGLFDTLASAGKTTAQNVSAVAGAAGAVRASIDTIQAAVNGPTPGQRAVAQKADAENNLYLAAVALAGILLIG